MVFRLSMMSSDVVSSQKACLYGTRACWSCLAKYPLMIDCDSACIYGSFCIA